MYYIIIKKSESKIKLLSEQLEICLYNKHLNTIAPEKNFNSELKTLYMVNTNLFY